jgi:hypothetical protein
MSQLQLLGYVTSNSTTSGELISVGGPMQSTFGDLSVAENNPMVAGSFPYDYISVIDYIQNTSGAGNISAIDGKAKLSVVSGTDTAELTNKNHVKYQNGQGLLCRFTCYFDNFGVGTNGYVGYFDSQDGYLIGYNTTDGLFVIRRYKGTDEKIIQANFNMDTLDGNGSSGFTYNPIYGNAFQIGVAWLGFANINFCIMNPETGQHIPFHMIKFGNTSQNTSCANPSLQFNMLCESGGGAGDLYCPSYAIFLQGPVKVNGPVFSSMNSITIGGGADEVLAIRNKATVNGINNRSSIRLNILSLAYQTNDEAIVQIWGNPTITGGTWSDVLGNETPVEENKTMTGFSGGRLVTSFVLSEFSSQIIQFKNDVFLQPNETLLIVYDHIGGGTGDAGAVISWQNVW